MALPDLRSDRLLVLVFGPGKGELILVHAPPGRWLVVDGCRKQGQRWYAQLALDHYGVRPDILVLTHPHQDHAGGVADLVEELTPESDTSSWPVLGMVEPPDLRWVRRGDDVAGYSRGITEQAVATIRSRWELHPPCRWEMPVGDRRALGNARLTVLSPEPETLERARRRFENDETVEPNHVASAVLLEWEAVRVVLGSDLEPATAWKRALKRAPLAADHVGLKVAHHTSVDAQFEPLLARSRSAVRIATPFSTQDLPKFGREGGIALLHRTCPEVHLTALPRAYGAQGGAGGARLERTVLDRGGRELDLDPPVTAFPDCFVAVEWDPSGTVAMHHGPGSVVVVPKPRPRASTRRRRGRKRRGSH